MCHESEGVSLSRRMVVFGSPVCCTSPLYDPHQTSWESASARRCVAHKRQRHTGRHDLRTAPLAGTEPRPQNQNQSNHYTHTVGWPHLDEAVIIELLRDCLQRVAEDGDDVPLQASHKVDAQALVEGGAVGGALAFDQRVPVGEEDWGKRDRCCERPSDTCGSRVFKCRKSRGLLGCMCVRTGGAQLRCTCTAPTGSSGSSTPTGGGACNTGM